MANKIELLRRGELAVITIQNPPYNTLSAEVLGELPLALEAVKIDTSVKVVIITGRGLFSAGADVKDIWRIVQKHDMKEALDLLAKANATLDSIEDLGKPTVAVIDGMCLGGGNELAMACTARIATEDSRFGQPEINLGIMPGMGGTQRLSRLIELEPALRILLSGTLITAKDAFGLGMIDKVVPKKSIQSEAKNFASLVLSGQGIIRNRRVFDLAQFREILSGDAFGHIIDSKSKDAVESIVKAVESGMVKPLSDALKLEQELFAKLIMKDSAKRGLAKFLKIDLEPKKTEAKVLKDDTSDKEDDLRMFRDMVREFAEKEIRPLASKMEVEGRMSRDLFRKMGEQGFYAASFPEEYGGADLGKMAYCIVFEELARAYGSSAVVVGAHTGLACGSIYLGGNEAQKQKYLVPALEGKLMGAFALTEPSAGSDSGNIKTTAVRKNGGWVINGAKRFITNGKDADFTIVIAQTDPMLKKDGLVAFIVETKWPGYNVGKIEHKLGIRGSQTVELSFQDLFVPDENLLGEVGKAFKLFMKTLNGGRLGLAAGCVGSSKRAFEIAYEHSSERVQFDQPLLMNQAIQFYLARMRANIYLMEEATYNAARMADAGKDIRLEAACVKLQCSEMNMWNVDHALQILGGDGYSDESEISRIWRDGRINPIFEGTNEIQQLLIFKEIFTSGGKI
ncbi:MAG: acyl-CoA dehydrogenase family protein [Candidatus Yanofskybacteria bacterium]|nr:acyl-CoA dehydrogenase family protein [Candidatus Yanofskybacteria bacterium]